jgi:hypothetical protein
MKAIGVNHRLKGVKKAGVDLKIDISGFLEIIDCQQIC